MLIRLNNTTNVSSSPPFYMQQQFTHDNCYNLNTREISVSFGTIKIKNNKKIPTWQIIICVFTLWTHVDHLG
jgi:hypothetical protein